MKTASPPANPSIFYQVAATKKLEALHGFAKQPSLPRVSPADLIPLNSQPGLGTAFRFLVDRLTGFDFPEALKSCHFHLRRARFPFCVFNNSASATQPACFLPGATIAVLTVLQRSDSLHIITSNTRHGLSGVHQYPLITLPLTLSLLKRILCIPAYFPLNFGALLLSASSACLCFVLQSAPHYWCQRFALSRVLETPAPASLFSLHHFQLALCHFPPTSVSTCLPFTSISPIVISHSGAVTGIIRRKCAALLWNPD